MEATLKQFKDDKNIASKLLGISTRTIYRRLDEKQRRKRMITNNRCQNDK